MAAGLQSQRANSTEVQWAVWMLPPAEALADMLVPPQQRQEEVVKVVKKRVHVPRNHSTETKQGPSKQSETHTRAIRLSLTPNSGCFHGPSYDREKKERNGSRQDSRALRGGLVPVDQSSLLRLWMTEAHDSLCFPSADTSLQSKWSSWLRSACS